MTKRVLMFLLPFLGLCFSHDGQELHGKTPGSQRSEIDVSSPAFTEGGTIPQRHTCDGEDISPPLAWTGVPQEAKTLALVCDDPDAPTGTWVHWVLFNLPATTKGLPAGAPSEKTVCGGAKHGLNDFGNLGYRGPCPPAGTHRYFFTLYALDIEMGHESGITKKQLLEAMEGHILAQGQLMGKYKR